MLSVFARAVTYGTLFVSLVLIYLPGEALKWSGVVAPDHVGVPQVAGMAIGAAGAALALWSILSFIVVGRGTPAPFDPPRLLVVQRAVHVRAEPDVLRRQPRPWRRCPLLRFDRPPRVPRGVHPRRPFVRGFLRGTDARSPL